MSGGGSDYPNNAEGTGTNLPGGELAKKNWAAFGPEWGSQSAGAGSPSTPALRGERQLDDLRTQQRSQMVKVLTEEQKEKLRRLATGESTPGRTKEKDKK